MDMKFCPACGEPLFREVTVFGNNITMRRMCECRRREKEEEEAMDRANVMFSRIKRILELGYMDPTYAEMTFAAGDSKESKVARDMEAYAEHFDKHLKNNRGIFLYGNAGVGKTFYASCIANAIRKRGDWVLIGTAADLVKYFTKDFGRNEEAEDQIRRYPLMVIDDIGMEKTTENSLAVMNEIINMRYMARKPLICTSNYPLSKLYEGTGAYGERITSRLSEMCVPYKLTGKDRRRK